MPQKTNTPAVAARKPLQFFVLLTVAVLLSIAGCAKIGDPQPPEILIPKAAVDLTVSQRANTVVLRISKPQQNTNGSTVTTLHRVEVYRQTSDISEMQNSKPISADQFRLEAEQVLSIPEARITDYEQQNFLVIEDTFSNLEQSSLYTHTFRYAVLFVNDKNQAAGFSNQAVIAPIRLPLPPAGLRAEVTETSIHLIWKAPLENRDGSKRAWIPEYNVYRSTERELIPKIPINPKPLKKPEFNDVHFDFDKTYYYRVNVVADLQGSLAESLLSKDLTVTPRDVFPPLPVGNFIVNFEGNFVLLLWNPSPSPDIAGYRISKREKGTTAVQILQQELIMANSYRDNNVRSDEKYEYNITVIDTNGNESSAVQAETTTR